jgi:hypothetical protein
MLLNCTLYGTAIEWSEVKVPYIKMDYRLYSSGTHYAMAGFELPKSSVPLTCSNNASEKEKQENPALNASFILVSRLNIEKSGKGDCSYTGYEYEVEALRSTLRKCVQCVTGDHTFVKEIVRFVLEHEEEALKKENDKEVLITLDIYKEWDIP